LNDDASPEAMGATFSWPEVQEALRSPIPTGTGPDRLQGVSTDTRTLTPRSLFFALSGPRFDGHHFVAEALEKGAGGVVIRRDSRVPAQGDASSFIQVEDPCAALGQLGRYARDRWNGRLVAVTGSFGKTTTKEMIGRLLGGDVPGGSVLVAPGNENNSIGVPRLLAGLDSTHRYAVVEMGTSSPGEIVYLGELARPDVAVLTGIGAAHLECLIDVEGVAREKGALLDTLRPGGTAVLNGDDVNVRALGEKTAASRASSRAMKRVHFGLGEDNTFRATEVVSSGLGMRFRVEGRRIYLPLLGVHNVMNALAAYAVCRELGVDRSDLIDRIETLRPIPRRMEPFRAAESLVIDDSYNANPPAMRAALKVLQELDVPGRRIFLAGEMKELGVGAEVLHREFGKAASDSGIDVLWAIGPFAVFVLEGARPHMGPDALAHFEDAEAAALALPSFLRPGDAVLVKGSRSVHMGGIIRALKRALKVWPYPSKDPSIEDCVH